MTYLSSFSNDKVVEFFIGFDKLQMFRSTRHWDSVIAGRVADAGLYAEILQRQGELGVKGGRDYTRPPDPH